MAKKFYLGIAVLVLRARVVKVYLLVLLVPLCGAPHKGTYADLSIMWNGMSAMLPKPRCELGFGY
jgi:hypothetical protein